MLYLDLARATALRGADECVILRMVEAADVRDVGAELTSEERAFEWRVGRAWVPVEPGEIRECEGVGLLADGIRGTGLSGESGGCADRSCDAGRYQCALHSSRSLPRAHKD